MPRRTLPSKFRSQPVSRLRSRRLHGRQDQAVGRKRDWPTWIGVGTALIAALGALIFNGVAARSTTEQLDLTRQGQITDRYSKAVEQLGNGSSHVRLGGVYALERLMHDSPGDQPTIMEVLGAFVRDSLDRRPKPDPSANPKRLSTDVLAALTVLARRDRHHDLPGRTVDLSQVDISYVYLAGLNLTGVKLAGVKLTGANLIGANLTSANLTFADLSGADLGFAELSGAYLTNANLTGANLTSANLARAHLPWADLSRTHLGVANLSDADLSGANLSDANLSDANLTAANLTAANLTSANLTGANLTAANLTGANLTGANLTGARGYRKAIPPIPSHPPIGPNGRSLPTIAPTS